jgi:hypothetical protein
MSKSGVALEVKCSETFPFELVFLASAMSVIVVNSVNLVKDKQMSMEKNIIFFTNSPTK